MNHTATPDSSASFLARLVREPTAHFLLLAGLIFLVYGFSNLGGGQRLEIQQQEIDARLFLQELSMGQELTEEQRQNLTAAYIEEQILVAEARAMGLDNDARIDDMLAQKMRHVLSGGIIQPSAEELTAYYEAHRDRYTSLPTVSVDELVFNTTGALSEDVTALLTGNTDTDTLLNAEAGTASLLPNVNYLDLANIFSEVFAARVFDATENTWIGPFVSNRGQHWLRIFERRDALLPPLEDIADRVRLDWIAQEEDLRLQEEVDKLWDRYTISIIAADESD